MKNASHADGGRTGARFGTRVTFTTVRVFLPRGVASAAPPLSAPGKRNHGCGSRWDAAMVIFGKAGLSQTSSPRQRESHVPIAPTPDAPSCKTSMSAERSPRLEAGRTGVPVAAHQSARIASRCCVAEQVHVNALIRALLPRQGGWHHGGADPGGLLATSLAGLAFVPAGR